MKSLVCLLLKILTISQKIRFGGISVSIMRELITIFAMLLVSEANWLVIQERQPHNICPIVANEVAKYGLHIYPSTPVEPAMSLQKEYLV